MADAQRLFSADGHVIEPIDLWQDRVAPEYRERVAERSHGMVTTGERDPSATAWAERPDTRAEVLDTLGVSGELLFPNKGLFWLSVADKDLLAEVVRVYNQWLAEWCAVDPDRFFGAGMLSPDDVGAAVEEVDRVAALGLGAVMLPAERADVRYNSSTYEPLWEAIERSGLPLALHVPPTVFHRGRGAVGANYTRSQGPFRDLFPLWVFSGILERHPGLRLLLIEGGISWLAGTLQDMDMIWERFQPGINDGGLTMRPSDYWRRQCVASFQQDRAGLEQVHWYGAETIAWGGDLPHTEGTGVDTATIVQELAEQYLHGEQASLVFGGNARRLLGLS